ncbi:MAG: hypothetical protein AAGL24_08745 [Pseudomonadota bacterium]
MPQEDIVFVEEVLAVSWDIGQIEDFAGRFVFTGPSAALQAQSSGPFIHTIQHFHDRSARRSESASVKSPTYTTPSRHAALNADRSAAR